MKKLFVFCLTAILIFCVCPASAAEEAQDASIVSGCSTLDGNVTYLGSQQLIENCTAAILYETTTDTLMYSFNADAQLPPASLVKILTALIAIEKGDLTDPVTVRADVLATLPDDAMVVELIPDEVVSVSDLLHCMMVASGNDAAAVLADYIMGSQEAFVAEMNRYAAKLGCTNTNFTNVHGLGDLNQYTSARDVARILAHAIQNEKFCEVFGKVYYTVPANNKSVVRYLSTENYLLNNDEDVRYYDHRVTGSRTGVANDRTRNIVSTAEDNGLKYVCIIMGAESEYEEDGYSIRIYGGYAETKQLLDAGFDGYKTAQILYENQVLLQSSVLNGSSDVIIGTHSGADSVIPGNIDAQGLTYRYVDEVNLVAPIEKGQKLSSVQVWCESVCIAQTDLFAMNSVSEAAALPLNNPQNGDNGFWTILLYVFGAIGGIVLVSFVVLSFLRMVRIAKKRKQSRRNRRNRRRSR